MDNRIFEDLLVVDRSTFVTGGFCSLMLANQDADVVNFVEAGVPAGPVRDVEDALYNEQTESWGVMRTLEKDGAEVPVIEHPLNFAHGDSGFESPPPDLGEHTREVLADLGYDEDRLDEMADAGAFGDD